jgi:hypothetical protein
MRDTPPSSGRHAPHLLCLNGASHAAPVQRSRATCLCSHQATSEAADGTCAAHMGTLRRLTFDMSGGKKAQPF